MLRLILGGAGSGKTSYIVGEIRSRLGRAADMVLLAPEQYSHRYERLLAASCGPALSLSAEVLSFTRLYSRVAAQIGGLADPIPDRGGRLLLMSLALDSAAPKLRYYGSRGGRAEFLLPILKAAEEIRAAMISPSALLEASEAAEGTIADKLHDLALICEAYEATLAALLGDGRDRVRRLADGIGESSVGAGGFYMDGFTDFTALEYEVIDGILRRGTDITAALTYRPGGAEHFRLTETTLRRLSSLARRRNIAVETVFLEPDGPYGDPACAYLADRLFDYAAPPLTEDRGSVELYCMSSRLGECRLAAARILELLREDGSLRFSDFAVAVPSYEAYSAAIDRAFRDYGVPLYSGEKSELAQKSLVAFVLEALETVNGGWQYRNVFRYLKTGLAGLAPDERDLLENYCLTWEIRGEALWTRPEPWDMNPRGYVPDRTEADAEKLNRINELRARVAAPLERLSGAVKSARTAREHIYALWRFLDAMSLSEALLKKAERLAALGMTAEAEEQSRLWDVLIDCLEQFSEVLGGLEMDGEEFRRMLELLLTTKDIGSIPPALDGVPVGGLDRLRGVRPRCLLILGADDASLPSLPDGGGLFSEDERRRLFDLGIRLGFDRDESVYRQLHGLYQSLGSAENRLIVAYAGGENRRPSFLIKRAEALLNIKTINESELGGLHLAAAPRPCLSLALAGSGEAAAAAAECVDGEELSRLLSLVGAERGSLSPAAVSGLYGERLNLTASRAETFNSCQFMYFMQYGLRARERRKAGFEAPELGTFVHYILEKVAAGARAAGGFGKLSEEEVRKLAEKYAAEYVGLFFTGGEMGKPRFAYLFNRLKAAVDAIILDVAAELSSSDFEPLDFELQFAEGADMPPAEVGDVKISGMVDRVDGWLNERDGRLYLRVADYKTGKKKFSYSDVRYGIGIQMLVYLFVLAEHGFRRYGREVVPAGVLYTPARDVLLPLPRSSSPEEIAKKRSDELRRSGLILADEAVIEAMEHGRNTRFIPVKFKNGVPTGSLASAEMFGRLGGFIGRLLEKMGRELKSGCIAANPLEKGEAHSPCLYCPYKEACAFDSGRDKARKQHSIDEDEFWRHIAEGGE